MLIENILIEQEWPHLEIKNYYAVELNFKNDLTHNIGTVRVFKNGFGICGNFDLNDGYEEAFLLLFPSIGYRIIAGDYDDSGKCINIRQGEIISIGLCSEPNLDPTIKCLGDQILDNEKNES